LCLKGTAARSRQDSWASPAKKIRPQAGHPPPPRPKTSIWRSVVKIYVYKLLCHFLPTIVKIKPQLGNLELVRFPRSQVILLGHFGVQQPRIWPSGSSGTVVGTRPLQLRQAGSWAMNAWYVSKESCKHRV
jgi:hypothetical protein